jgi:hypothetical protein
VEGDGSDGGDKTGQSYDFEDEPADEGVPERFEPVVDARDRGQTRNGYETVTSATAASGDQSFMGRESETGNVLFSRPASQPFDQPRTTNVSISLRRPPTNHEGSGGRNGGIAAIQLYEGVGNEPPIEVKHDGSALKYKANGHNQRVITSATDFSEWARVTIFDIDPESDTFSVEWETPDESGVANDLPTGFDMEAGYTSTVVHFDDEGYADNLVIGGTSGESPGEGSSERELRDSSNDGIPDAVADANPKIPRMAPLASPDSVARINIDPYSKDTSGDGLPDKETIDVEYRVFEEDGETKLEMRVTNAKHHPAKVDTNDDGLTDREQIDGWEIEVIDDHGPAEEMMAGLRNPDVEVTPQEYFETRPVDANPWEEDTDGDGLSDVTEKELGTDPSQTDTTDDGIPDDYALELREEDPTVFTTSPPTATLHSYETPRENERMSFPRQLFKYGYSIRDNHYVGISEWELVRNGITLESRDYTDTSPHHVDRTDVFKSEVEVGLSILRGSKTSVWAEDSYGNGRTTSLYTEYDLATTLLAHKDGMSHEDAGKLSGLTNGIAELPVLLQLLWNEPQTILDATEYLATNTNNEILIDIAVTLPKSTHDSQDRANPYEKPKDSRVETVEYCAPGGSGHSEDYCQFAWGWYKGYAAFLLVETAEGAGSLRTASSADDVADTIRRSVDNGDDIPRRLRNGDVSDSQVIGYRLLEENGRYLDDLSVRFGTAGKTAKAVKRLDQVDSPILRNLDGAQKTELLRHLADNPNGAQLVNSLGPKRTNQLFALSVRRTDNVQLRGNLFRLHSQGVSTTKISRFVNNVDELTGEGGLDNLVRTVVNNANKANFKGAEFEARLAAAFKRSDGYSIKNLANEVKTNKGSTEIDIQLRSGSTIEAKAGSLKYAKGSREYRELTQQIQRQIAYRSENGLSGSHYIAVDGEMSDAVRSYLRNNDVNVLSGSEI